MSLLAHFFLAFAISFVGSLPFGMINMTVAHTAIRKGMQAALFMAAGASLVELLQAFVAVKFTWLFQENAQVEHIFQVVAITVFVIAGTYFFFFAKSKPDVTEAEPQRRLGHFFRGMFISSLNLMIIPYWIFYATLLTANDLLVRDNLHVFIFAVGTAVGTFALLVLYSMLGVKILSKSEQVTKWVNKFIGVVLFGFAAWQAYKMMNGH
jgi:threonine/homoserine/homoserine lactone efflux protein